MDRYPFSAGIGLGVAVFTNKTVCPKLSLFSGSGLFVNLDYVYKKTFAIFANADFG